MAGLEILSPLERARHSRIIMVSMGQWYISGIHGRVAMTLGGRGTVVFMGKVGVYDRIGLCRSWRCVIVKWSERRERPKRNVTISGWRC